MTVFGNNERLLWSPPSSLTSEEWGCQNRELSVLTSASAGRWSMDPIPFLRPVLAALDDHDIDTVVLAKSTQIAGTETILTWLARVAAEDPGPAMIVFADQDTAEEICERRIQPMFRSSPVLARLIDERKFGKQMITMRNGFSLTMAWASSIGRTASRPIRYLIMDEITKPAYGQTQDEGSVIYRVLQRTETFQNRKIVMLSSVTVEGDNMQRQLGLCDVVEDWHVPCPACGAYQVLRFRAGQSYRSISGAGCVSGGVVWPDDSESKEAAKHAVYQCGDCKAEWTTAEKNAAVSRGRASPRTDRPADVRRWGYHVSRLYSLFPGGRLDELARSFLLAKEDRQELQGFCNNALAEWWSRYVVKTDENALRGAQCDLERGVVPDQADVLIASIDMQKTGFWYLVRAWCCRTKESWMIECGRLLDWGDVDDLFFDRTWATADGKVHGIWRGTLDTGGSKDEHEDVSRTEQAYDWWIANRYRCSRRIFLCKGSSRALPTKTAFGKPLEVSPSGKKLVGGLVLLFMNTNRLKDMFMDQLMKACDGGSKAAHLHKDTPDQYFKHIASEAPDENGIWMLQKGKDNHWLDCEMMAQGAVCPEIMGGLDAIWRVLAANQPNKQPENVEKQGETEQTTDESRPKTAPEPAKKPLMRRPNPWSRRPGGL